ncbi:MAG: SLBB domain-containing protein [Candidatus Schekmanbacteria bacterium]|nr:SLBB domain-containing protein [Candidatus Schekmanbacteria bacterium]
MKISIDTIAAAGVVGAGGAGFPTYAKLSAKADTVLLNAAECEPLLHKDKEVLRAHAEEVIEGLVAACELVGARRAVIGIKEKYQDVIALLRGVIPRGVELAPLRDVYPAGDEFVLVYAVLGRAIPPGGLPLDVGAVVINVETALNIARSPTTPVIEKFVSVAGAVAHPCTVRAPLGAPLSTCLAAAGGVTADAARLIVGGVMMGRLESDPESPVLRTTGAVIVLPAGHVAVRRYERSFVDRVRIGRAACDQCSFCTEQCPRYLLGHPVEPHKVMRSLGFSATGEANVRGALYCSGCSLCSLSSCPEDLDPGSICADNKRRLLGAGQRWPDAPFNPNRPRLHLANRSTPMSRLMRKLGLTGFANVGPLCAAPVAAGTVTIPLKQHIGAAGVPCVAPGARVARGEAIALPPAGRAAGLSPAPLGVPVHASLSGIVTAVTATAVTITAHPSGALGRTSGSPQPA